MFFGRTRAAAKHALCAVAILALSAPILANGGPPGNPLGGIAPRERIAGAVDENVQVALPGNRHPDAIQKNDVGPAPDVLRLERMILALKADATQTAALDAYLEAARNPGGPAYGQWLTPQAFEDHFGVAASDIGAISAWLTGHGFAIDEIPAGRLAIVFSGTAAQVREAFHTEIHRYLVDGEIHLANSGDPQIPAALAAVVRGVVSLHDFRSRPLNRRKTPAPDYTSGSTHYLAPADFATIYDVRPLAGRSITGNGRSIAVLGRSNVVLSDIAQFRSVFGLPANPPSVIVNGADPGLVSGDHGESDLDLEWSGAVAPAAAVSLVTSKSTASTDGIALSAQYAVANNVADIVSLSYGQCEATLGTTAVAFYNNLWQQAAAQGTTVLVSSGDSGAAGCDSPTATRAIHGRGINGLCSSPYSTCVGGTEFADTSNPSLYWSSANGAGSGSALSYIPEVVWNESGANGGTNLWATGGGASIAFAKPSWQSAPGVPADGARDVPDVALSAAGHVGYLVYSSDNSTQTQSLYVFSGTSAAAPAFAGLIALVNQRTGYRQGSVGPTLYGLASRQASGGPAYFHPITSGNNSVPGVTGFAASSATPYYNQATGLGSVDADVLVSHWTDLLPPSSTSLSVAPNPGRMGQTVTLTATVSGMSPTGTVQFADNGSSLGAPVALAGGVAKLATTALAAGNHSITAAYSGDVANLASTSAAVAETILAASSVALSSSATAIPAGQGISFTATVSGAAPTGTVQFMDAGANLGAPVALSGTVAILSTNALATAGSHAITAAYSGDAANAPSSSPALTVTVTPAASSVSIAASASSITAGQSVTFTATVRGAAPTGTVRFQDGGTALGTSTLSGGVATWTTAALGVGSHAIAAVYSGDANNAGSTSPVITETVAAALSTDADVPTLPDWGVLLLGSLLLLTHQRQVRRHSRNGL